MSAHGAPTWAGAQRPSPAQLPPEASAEVAGLPNAAEYCRFGLCVEGLEWFAREHADRILPHSTTSDVCHEIIKPSTTPHGWRDDVRLINPDKRWFAHHYRCDATGETQTKSPAGTCSFCELMLTDPVAAPFIGRPTVFFSHAWLFCFLNVVAAMRAFADAQPAGSPTVFFWFDCFSIDEHATQSFPPSWWDTTFLEAIQLIGHTVMMLSPWDNPVPLTRAWCLWELLCTIHVGAKFDVCLGPQELAKFEQALETDLDGVMRMVGVIDAQQAEAGDPEDRDRIFAAITRLLPRGFLDLNNRVKERLREWTYQAGEKALEAMVASASDAELRAGSIVRATSRLIGELTQYYRKQGQFERAEPLCREAVAGQRLELGDEHEQTLASISTLGQVLSEMGEQEKAEPLLIEVLAARRRLLGSSHQQTLESLVNLAMALFELGAYSRAEPLYVEAISTSRRTLGDTHPETLTALNNLGLLHVEEGEYSKAVPILDEARRGRRKTLGDDAPDTLITIIYSGWMYSSMAKYEIAQPLIEEAVSGCRRVLGDAHPKTLSSINLLGLLFSNMGHYAASQAPSRESFELRERKLGSEHPLTLVSLTNLAMVHHGLREFVTAEAMLTRVVEVSLRTLGDTHSRCLGRSKLLEYVRGNVAQETGQWQRAMKSWEGLLPRMRQDATMGDNDPCTLKCIHDLGRLYLAHGKVAVAGKLLREATRVRDEVFGSDHPDACASRRSLVEWQRVANAHAAADAIVSKLVADMCGLEAGRS